MSKKTATIGCLSATAATIGRAKSELNVLVEAALTGSYDPVTVNSGSHTAIVYRRPEGWTYRVLWDVKYGVNDVVGDNIYSDKYEAIQSAAFHVLDSEDSENYRSDSDIPVWLTDRSKRDTILSNARFRRAYKHAQKTGIVESDELHAWACAHSHKF